MNFLQLIQEGFRYASQVLRVNKLRAILSLLGITIGIFCIILVYTLTDSLEISVRKSLATLGSDVVYVQKWPWGGGGEYPWWKYVNRPEPTYKEFAELEKRLSSQTTSAFFYSVSTNLKYSKNSVERTSLVGSTFNYGEIWNLDLARGRYFTEDEMRSGKPYIIIGQLIADGLFENEDPIGKQIKMLGGKYTVIGVFAKAGQSMFGNSYDDMVLLPLQKFMRIVNTTRLDGGSIMVKGGPGMELDEIKDEIMGAMRSVRRLSPKQEENFALNETTTASAGLANIFGIIGLAGTIIGGFAILVGGFGIANIMFVSVKERTGQIGIQKALGARGSFILSQFLMEAVLLAIAGGLVGLLFVYLCTLAIGDAAGFPLLLTGKNIAIGIGISVTIGLLAGLIPAFSASRLDPVEAIRSSF